MYKITVYKNGALTEPIVDKEKLRLYKAQKGKSCTRGETITLDTFEEVANYASKYPISPSALKDGKRANAAFEETKIMVVDIDDNITLQNALAELDMMEYRFALYTSYSHGVGGQDKFHIILELEDVITNVEDFKATYKSLESLFGDLNHAQTSAPSNLFFNSNPNSMEVHRNKPNNNKLVKVVKALKNFTSVSSSPTLDKQGLSKRTLKFLVEGAENGEWHIERNLAAKNLKAAGYSIDEAKEKIKGITGTLDSADIYQIEYAYKSNSFNYNLEVVPADSHKLRLQYTNTKGKFQHIPVKIIVDEFFDDKKVAVDLSGQYFVDGSFLDAGSLTEDIRNFAESKLKQICQPSIIAGVIARKHVDLKQKSFNDLKHYVEFTGKNNLVDKFVEALTGKIDDIDVKVIKHFLWQIKRKMFRKEVTYHMMPVLVGPTGCGKSVSISKLLDPIEPVVYADGDFKKLVDTREAFNLVENYIYFIDEMSKANYADVETIKNKITSKMIQYRILGTNNKFTGLNNATFIGCSNSNLDEIIKDSTSARRFYQINTKSKIDWDTINSIDFLELWRGIDEGQQSPYIFEDLEEISNRQEHIRHKAPAELFIKETYSLEKGLKVNEVETKISRKRLYLNYQAWCIENGYKFVMTKHSFCATLKKLLGEPKRGNVDNVFTDYYILKEIR